MRHFLAVARSVPDTNSLFDSLPGAFVSQLTSGDDIDLLRHYHVLHTAAAHLGWSPSLLRRLGSGAFGWGLVSPCAAPPESQRGMLYQSLFADPVTNKLLLDLLDSAVNTAEHQAPIPPEASRSALEVLCSAQPLMGNEPIHRPASSRHDGRSASTDYNVRLRFVVGKLGRVDAGSVAVDGGIAPAVLADAAMRAAVGWRFAPALLATGDTVPQGLHAIVHFPAVGQAASDSAVSLAVDAAVDSARLERRDLVVITTRVQSGEAVATQVRSSDSVLLHVEDGGPHAAHPIVLLHALPSGARWLDRIADALREQRRTVVYDLRGFGTSTPATNGDYSMDAHVRDLAAVISALHLKRPILIGATEGALVALAYAAQHADEVGGVFYAGVPMFGLPEIRRADLTQTERVARGEFPHLPAAAMESRWDGPQRDRYLELVREADRRAMDETSAAMAHFDASGAIEQLHVPVWSFGVNPLRSGTPPGPPLGVRVVPASVPQARAPGEALLSRMRDFVTYVERDDAAARAPGCTAAAHVVRHVPGRFPEPAIGRLSGCGSFGLQVVAAVLLASSTATDTARLRQLAAFVSVDDRGDVIRALGTLAEDSSASVAARTTGLIAFAEMVRQSDNAVYGRPVDARPLRDPFCAMRTLAAFSNPAGLDGRWLRRVNEAAARALADSSARPTLKRAAGCLLHR